MISITKSRTLKVLVLFVAAVATVMISGESCANQWETVSAGTLHSLALLKNGSLLAWGSNEFGQVGTGDKNKDKVYFEPVLIKDGAKWLQIATKFASSFGILSDGTLWAWGSNYGNLGDDTKADRLQPVQIGQDNDWIMVAPGEKHTLALKRDGSLWVFGFGGNGELGIPALGNTLTKPTRIQADHKWVRIAAGSQFSFAIREDGTLWGFGANQHGQLGVNSTDSKFVPVQIAPQIIWKEIYAGNSHALGLDVEGKLYAWGDNKHGQLGDGTLVAKLVPTRVIGNSTWKKISAGHFHSLGLMEDGSLFAWGYNKNGQFGDGTNENRASPVQIGKEFVWKSVSAGLYHTIAVTNSGYLMTWGQNSKGQLGNGNQSKKEVLSPSICSGTGGFCFQDKCESSCPEGSLEFSHICYKCEEGTYFDEKTTQCSKKCLTWSGIPTYCTSCEYPLVLDEENHKCTDTCDPNCLRCYKTTKICTSCREGEGKILHRVNKTCEQCHASCKTCKGASFECTSCESELKLEEDEHSCVSDCDSNCLTCSGSTKKCTSCHEGYTLSPESSTCRPLDLSSVGKSTDPVPQTGILRHLRQFIMKKLQ